jgi:hypothetical protein
MEREIFGGAPMDEVEGCDRPLPALTARDVCHVLRDAFSERRTRIKVGTHTWDEVYDRTAATDAFILKTDSEQTPSRCWALGSTGHWSVC